MLLGYTVVNNEGLKAVVVMATSKHPPPHNVHDHGTWLQSQSICVCQGSVKIRGCPP